MAKRRPDLAQFQPAIDRLKAIVAHSGDRLLLADGPANPDAELLDLCGEALQHVTAAEKDTPRGRNGLATKLGLPRSRSGPAADGGVPEHTGSAPPDVPGKEAARQHRSQYLCQSALHAGVAHRSGRVRDVARG